MKRGFTSFGTVSSEPRESLEAWGKAFAGFRKSKKNAKGALGEGFQWNARKN